MTPLFSLVLALLVQQPQEIVQAWHEAGEFEGLALVAKEGKVVYQGAVGLADRSLESAHQVDAVFPIASLTKQFTAVLVFQAIDQGELALDDTLAAHLPSMPQEVAEKVQIQHLLLHAGGFQDPPLEHYLDPRNVDWTDTRIVEEYLVGQSPSFEPGTQFAYSNADYHLLGAVLESATGESFEMLVRNRIAVPLGLVDTRLARRSEVRRGRARDYVPAGIGGWQRPTRFDWSHWKAAGGLESSLRDLHRWNQALSHHELLKPETTQLMLTSPGAPNPYVAYGSWVYERPIPGTETTLRVAERRGAIGGHAVLNALDLKRKSWVILYSNHANRTLDTLSYAPCLPLDLFSSAFGGEVTKGGKASD